MSVSGVRRSIVLETRNLRKKFNRRTVVRDVSMEIRRGEIVGLLGPNGAGKTTVFHMIIGILRPDAGRVIFDNRDITRLPIHLRARLGMGYLPQEPSVFQRLTVRQNILAILETLPLGRKQRLERLERLLEELKISRLADNMAYTLSGGERRRLEITRALVTDPSFIMLDEPFSGIEPIIVADIQQMIGDLREKGLGILLTDHNVRDALSITDRSYLIANGSIFVSGTPGEVLNSESARAMYLGAKFTM